MATTQQLEVAAPGPAQHYPVTIAHDALKNATYWQPVLATVNTVLLVSDAMVSPLYQAELVATLQQAKPGVVVIPYTLPVGEGAKQWHHAHALLTLAAEHNLTRQDAVLALGGGVVSDLAGLVAALHHRGCRFLVAPTTVLAMVDASVGGKVAVNHTLANNQLRKNAHGTFYSPHAVVMDTATLSTLAPAVRRAGLAEVLKTALLESTARHTSGAVHPWLNRASSMLLNTLATSGITDEGMPDTIAHCVAIKATVVALDPTESPTETPAEALTELGDGGSSAGSPRMWLNLGHTFAHAYETLTEGALSHGDAVALGLLDAAAVSVAMGYLPNSQADALAALHQQLGLNHRLPSGCAITPAAMLQAMAHDKKQAGATRRLVLPMNTLGEVTVTSQVPDGLLTEVLTAQLHRHARG